MIRRYTFHLRKETLHAVPSIYVRWITGPVHARRPPANEVCLCRCPETTGGPRAAVEKEAVARIVLRFYRCGLIEPEKLKDVFAMFASSKLFRSTA
jgi:hypothetical protein